MGKIRVLVADRFPALLEGLYRYLNEMEDIEVVAKALDGEEALNLTMQTIPDVVLINADLPKMSGFEVIKKMKEAHPKIAAIVISVHSHDAYVVSSLKAGAIGYLLKDTSLPEFANAIRLVYLGKDVIDTRAFGGIVDYLNSDTKQHDMKINFREMEVIRLLARGMRDKDLARELGLSERTVHAHLSNIFRKMGVTSRTEAILDALKRGLVNLQDIF